ncbi:hypothetical protein QFC21_003385 [Naganishia friedmannii]|uniref:Uncharacterized protein n=1 Tax=Naganishia friedmannii TaxID=89922 RepID=A0ACC2VPD5_9TREE|nr:hypothetical protein QFC21_003385 [Naganishia friedmannii]
MDGSGMTPSAQTLPSPSTASFNNAFAAHINGQASDGSQPGYTNGHANGSANNMPSVRSIPPAAQQQLLNGFSPDRYRAMLKRAEYLRATGWTEQTSSDLSSIMALLHLWQSQRPSDVKNLASANAETNGSATQAGHAGMSGQQQQFGLPGTPTLQSSANMTPAQLAQLRTQVQAFKQLGKNIPLPLHIQQAILGASLPATAESGELKAVEQTIQVLKREEQGSAKRESFIDGVKVEGKESGSDARTDGVDARPLPRALELDKENPIYPYNSISQDPHTYLQPLGRGTAYNASKMQVTLVPSLMPKGLDPYLLLEERNRRIDQRIAWRMEELGEFLSTAGAGGDGAQPVNGLTNISYNGRPLTWDGQAISNSQVRSVIELRMLRLRDKQKLLREDIVRDMNAASQLPIERSDFRRFRSFALRDARQIEEAERIQRLERERQSKDKHLAYVKGICDHGRSLIRSAHESQDKAKRLGLVVLAAHRNQEKEEAKRLAQLSKDRLKALKADDEAGYRALLDQAKDTRITHLLKRTDTYLDSLAHQIKVQKQDVEGGGVPRRKGDDDQAGQKQESGEDSEKVDYLSLTHQIKERVTEQASMLSGGTLKSYQISGLEWMVSLYNNKLNGILADEMGLGKTIQTLSLITYLIEKKQENGPYLVLVPLSTLTNWTSEFTKWAPNVRTLVLKGDKQSRKLLGERVKRVDFQVLLTTYEYVIREVASLSKIKWHHMIIDEGHRMKNAKSKLALTLNERYSTKYRIILTGTPLQNSIPELWALLNFVLPKVFNSPKSFDEWFNAPFAGTGGEKAEMTEEEKLLVVKGLHKVLRPFLLRRLKKDVEADLPDKTEKIVKVKLSGLQQVLYKHMREHGKLIQDDSTPSTKSVAALQNMVIQLRKICQHPFVFNSTDNEIMDHLAVTEKQQYYNDDEREFTAGVLSRTAGKFELLDRILPKLFATGHKVLIFFQWTSVMNLAEEFMNLRDWKNCRLDGSTSADERQRLLSTFNDPSYGYQVFLLSTRAGGLGLNLQSADTVILYDSDYNPHADQQAQDRAHRIGQKKEVRVLRFVSTGTVEEGIVEIAKRKLALDGQIIQAGKFDGHSSAEERDNFLRTLLDRENEDTEEDAEPDEDTLNEIIARSEEEMVLFTKMDEERKQREIGQLPRLIAKEELPEPYTREYPKASELTIEAIEEEVGRGQRSRATVNYQEQNDLDDLLLEPMDDDADPVPNRRNRKLKGQPPDTKPSPEVSRPVSPAKSYALEDRDLEGSAGPSGRGRKRKEPSNAASNADDDVKPPKKRSRFTNDGKPPAPPYELAAMRAVQNRMWNYKNADGLDIVWPFKTKVPEDTPMYYESVKTPMWLNKIRNRMIQYHRIEEFQADMAQIWENAMGFNEPGSQFHEWAKELKQASEELYAQRFREVEAQRAARHLAPPADNGVATEEDVAMTPAASSTNGGDDVSYSGTSNSRPRLNLTLNASGSNSASPAPSVRGGRTRGRGSGRARGRGRGGARGSGKRILESDDGDDDPDADIEEPSGDEDD